MVQKISRPISITFNSYKDLSCL